MDTNRLKLRGSLDAGFREASTKQGQLRGVLEMTR